MNYRKVSNIRRTKFQTLNVSRLVWQLILSNPLKARCYVENEDVVGAAPTGDAPTTSEWSTILLRKMCGLYYRFDGNANQWNFIIHPCPNFNGGLVKPPLKLGHGWVNTYHVIKPFVGKKGFEFWLKCHRCLFRGIRLTTTGQHWSR